MTIRRKRQAAKSPRDAPRFLITHRRGAESAAVRRAREYGYKLNPYLIWRRSWHLGGLAFSFLTLGGVPLLPFGKRNIANLPFHTANKNVVGNWVVGRLLVLRAIKGAFGGVYVSLDAKALPLRGEPGVPVIFCSTHTGWWDGYMTFVCNERLFRHDGYLMMEEPNLARYPFLTWVGVFGVDRGDPRKALASIEYITSILSQKRGASLWMFPQGSITHPDSCPLKLYGGVANIVRRLDRCAVAPVAMRYEFLMEQAPDAFIRIDAPILFDMQAQRLTSRDITARIEDALTATAGRLHADVVAGKTADYQQVLGGRGSVNRVWDSVLALIGRVKNVARRG